VLTVPSLEEVTALPRFSPESGSTLSICSLAIFLTLGLVIALVDAVGLASAVPATAATNARTATNIAGYGRERVMRLIRSSPF
jgi:hypothetical protein